MSEVVFIDGVQQDAATASIPVLDRGFLYGDSVFEVLRTYGGRPFALRAHLSRLQGSCERLQIPWTTPESELAAEVEAALALADHSESYVRMVITRGVSAIGLLSEAAQPRRATVVLPLPEQPETLYREGRALATVTTARALDGTGAEGAKASNYLPNILATREARARGAYEAISVAAGGEVLEGATSNLFVVKDGAVETPPLRIGILGGITRETVMAAAADEGLAMRERLLFPRDLYSADELFITSSLREIVPGVSIDGLRIGDGRPGPITTRLHAAFARRVVASLGG